MKACLLSTSLLIVLLCGGCNLFKRPPTTIPELNTIKDIFQAQKTIEKSTTEIKAATSDIIKETQSIKNETNKTKTKVTLLDRKKIEPHLNKIDESSVTIEKNIQEINTTVAGLSSATILLNNAGEKITNIEEALKKVGEERENAIKARDKAIQDKNSQLHKTLQWIIVGCIVFAGIFIVLFIMHGSKFGLTGSAICIVICSISIFIQTYFIYVVIAGGFILLGLISLLVYNIIIKNKAFREVINTVEVTQDNLSLEDREKLFGGKGETGIMDTIQSRSTMNLIKKEKSRMSNLWEYAKNKK